jgi:hypothetical protein
MQLSAAADRYLAARRAVGFQLQDTENILRDFVAFATGRADTHVCIGRFWTGLEGATAAP